MKTKIFGLAFILILIGSQTFAQKRKSADSGITFGVLAGMNLQNFNGTDFWGEKLDNKIALGYHLGLNAMIPIAPDFFFQPGLLFSAKGARKKIIELPIKADDNSVMTNIRLSYLEVPLNLLFRPQLGDGHILLGFGPYMAYGITGKVKTKGGSLTNEMKVKFKNSVMLNDPSTYAYYRTLDAGANIFAGYELYSGIFIQLNVQLGLLKVNPSYELLSNDKTSYKNTGFGLSAGYRF